MQSVIAESIDQNFRSDFIHNMQACKIVEGQRYTKRLNEKQITSLLKVTCQRPREQEIDVLQVSICDGIMVKSTSIVNIMLGINFWALKRTSYNLL